jgi:aspartyl-tRNA(Asn)/glutamyl-tRNA(Gln) amidotransferase subunit A
VGAEPDPRTLTGLAAAIRAGELTSLEVVEQAVADADAVDAEIGVFLARFTEQALASARAADAARAAGRPLGPLHGVPIGIKDILTTREGPTTAQSLVLDPEWGSGDAVAVARLRDAGAIIMGKTTTMEFALGLPDASKPFPLPRNPWEPACWAGGSSSGSASGVVLGLFAAGIGTDTGGSIRIPSAFCGVTGLMPTYGRVPKSGCVPLGYTLDHIGPLATSARDCAVLLSVLAGADPSDPTSLDVPVDDYPAALDGQLAGVTIGVDRLSQLSPDIEDPALGPAIDGALDVLADRGARIIDVTVPYYPDVLAAFAVTYACEAMAYHRPDLQRRWSDYGADTRSMLLTATYYSGADYVQAQRVRRVGVQALRALFQGVDLVVTPVSVTGALTTGQLEREPRGWFRGIHTAYWDATGNPVASVPIAATAKGLPLALQVAGPPFAEGLVLRAADALQRDTDWHLRRPVTSRRDGRAD